jgi:hypothetical protein
LTLVRFLLPAAIVAFFLWKSYQSKIFLLGIPFLQVMGNSLFLESLGIFTMPRRFPSSVLILEWLLITWFLSVGFLDSEKRKHLKWQDIFGPRLVLPEEGVLIVLVGVWFFNFVSSIYNAVDINGVLEIGIDLGCMFLGYLLVRGIISQATRQEINSFLLTIILVNAIAAILYILNQGLHLPLYVGTQHTTEVYMGTLITRTFWWMPRFSFLSIAYVISKTKWNWISIGILIITFSSAFFSYSRNTIIIFVCLIVFALFISAIKQNISRSLLRLAIFMGAGIVVFWAISLFFPAEYAYLTSRFQNIGSLPSITATPNFAIRLEDFSRTFTMLQNKNQLLTGLGMASQVTNPAIFYLTQWTADITWVAVLYRYGIIGIVFFGLLFITFGIRTLREYFKTTSREAEEYWLMFFLIIAATFAESFVSWTIFDTRNITLSLWFFVFIAAAARRNRTARVDGLS